MFEVGDYDKATGNMSFGYGGFQGARGMSAAICSIDIAGHVQFLKPGGEGQMYQKCAV